MKTIYSTHIYLEKDDCWLMLLRNKKTNDLNKDKWIGVGGKLKPNETPLDCVKREVKEETGLTLNSATLKATLYFYYDGYYEVIYQYLSNDFVGQLIECDEGTLKYIKKDKILNLELWEGDRYFIKPLLDGEEYFEMKLVYENGKLLTTEKSFKKTSDY